MPLSETFHARAQEIIARYPVKRSALIPVLHAAQDEHGYLSADVMREVAKVMDLTPADVASVASFYTMFKMQNPGKYLLSLCTNVGCAIWGSDETAAKLRELIGPPHTPTPDGLVSWEPVECLAYCDWAPVASVNYKDLPQLTPERAEQLMHELKSGRELDDILADFRHAGQVQESDNA